VLHVRSGMIVGPHDPTDRFTYWVRRVSMGGEVLVPGPPDRPIELIHAADQAAWILSAAEREVTGVFHVTGPSDPHTMNEVLEACKEASGSGAQWVWAPEEILIEHEVAFWSEVPFVIEWKDHAVFRVDVSKAVGEGLTFRSLLQTVRETLAWDAMRDQGTLLKAGLAPERERELIEAVMDGRR
jgi:2'-hydroxyisoflavone reductase